MFMGKEKKVWVSVCKKDKKHREQMAGGPIYKSESMCVWVCGLVCVCVCVCLGIRVCVYVHVRKRENVMQLYRKCRFLKTEHL